MSVCVCLFVCVCVCVCVRVFVCVRVCVCAYVESDIHVKREEGFTDYRVLENLGDQYTLISQNVFNQLGFRSQLPHKIVNILFTFTNQNI